MHIEVRIGESMLMIGGDPKRGSPQRTAAMQLFVENPDEVFERAIAAGAKSLGGPFDTAYGERLASVEDAAGNHWYISTRRGSAFGHRDFRTVTLFTHPVGADAFLEFVESAFGAQPVALHRSPEGVIVHAQIKIGDSLIGMSESRGDIRPKPTGIYTRVDDPDAVYRQAIAAGAKSLWAPADQPYGARVAGVQDAWGNQWFIARPL
jgi:uncharacterized glyoxalase superfamily protein PhnB